MFIEFNPYTAKLSQSIILSLLLAEIPNIIVDISKLHIPLSIELNICIWYEKD